MSRVLSLQQRDIIFVCIYKRDNLHSQYFFYFIYLFIYFFFGGGGADSLFISVEDRTRRIQFSYNYSMSFTYSPMVITKQAGDTLYTRSYNLKDQNMYDHRSKHPI